MKKRFHPYHILKPSPWPTCLSISVGSTAISLVLYMNAYKIGGLSLIISLIFVVISVWYWWADVIEESLKEHTEEIRRGLRMGMILFIISEVMFFFSFFWAFFHSSLIPSIEIGGVWPPRDLQDIIVDPFGVPLLNTCILLTSGITVTWCHKLVIKPIYEESEAIIALTITILLAVLFLALQLMEYKSALICLSDGIYGSTFYMTTGFHGFHVMIGTIFLIICNYRLALGHFEDGNCVGLESAIWYWHFVDVVWIILFCFVYIWGNLKTANIVTIDHLF
jgi:heme/copper-type cytochrome/quinol oxidase subunit 3